MPYLEGANREADLPDFPQPGSTTTLRWSQAKQSFVVVGSEVEDKGRRLAEFTAMPFYGNFYYSAFPFGGVPARFAFSFTEDELTLRRHTPGTSCVFRGPFSLTADGISSNGSYECLEEQDFMQPPITVVGTFRARNLRVNSLGVYSGMMTMTPQANNESPQVHAGYRAAGAPEWFR